MTDPVTRLEECASVHDHQLVLADLRAALDVETESDKRALLHLRIGHLLRSTFLEGVGALKHFQESFKLDSARLDALGAAREVYREVGRLPLVQKLLKIEVGAVEDPEVAAALYVELGGVLVDLGDAENASVAYSEALKLGALVGALLEDAQVTATTFQTRLDDLLEEAPLATSIAERQTLLLRAASVARRYAADEADGLLLESYRLDPSHVRVAALLETSYLEAERVNELVAIQSQLLAEPKARPGLAFLLGARWAERHMPEVAAPFLEKAVGEDANCRPAIAFLKRWGDESPVECERVLRLAEESGGSPGDARSSSYLLATAGLLALREFRDVGRAQKFFERLEVVEPGHVALAEWRKSAGRDEKSTTVESIEESVKMDESSKEAAEIEDVLESPAEDEGGAAPVVPAAPAAVTAAPVVVSEAKIAELRQKLAAAEARPHEHVKALLELGEALPDADEKAALFRQAAELYAGKFANHAEAVKAYEKLLAADPTDAPAKAYLREMYEKRRDWESLISLEKKDAELLDPGPARTEAFRKIAETATEKVKKPEVCIELWQVVLENDPEDPGALAALVGLHERGRNYEALCEVLEKVVQVTYDDAKRIEYLTKLGQIAGDRLKDDVRAAEAYRQLLVLQPDDKRAQEQLKKRYVTLGRWDDLEVFYAESNNWDEFIRLLESNESRAESDAQRIGMLQKVAELWITQKGKPDRAARALEKILTIDETNLAAAQRLIPIYEEAKNPKGLVKAIEVKLANVEGEDERLALLLQVASLYEDQLRDKKSALAHMLEAVALAPADASVLDAAERVAKAAGGWDDLVGAYQNSAQAAVDDDVQVSLKLRLGRVLSDELGKVTEALAEFRAVYDDHPDNTEALSALENLYQKTEGWKELLEVYSRKLDLVTDPDERRATQFGIARVQRERMANVPAAIETYEAVLEDEADEPTALAALDELYAETKAWKKQAAVLAQRIELAHSDADLVELKFRLGQVLEDKLKDPTTALTNYREVLLLDLGHLGARQALEALLENEDLRGEAARILETVFEQQEDWQKLVRVLEVRAESAESTEEKVELLRKLAQISGSRLGSAEEAISAQARALRADPSNADARLELEELAENAKAVEKLTKIFKTIAEETDDADLSLQYWMRLAAIHERLGNVDAAAEAYEKVLVLEPGQGDALAALDALFRTNERWELLTGVYRRRIELATDPDQLEKLYSELAEVLEDNLGRPGDAVAAYQEVLAEQPTSLRALAALDQLFTKLGRFPELAANLESQLALAETDAESIALTLRLAALREEKMGQVEVAIEGYRDALERDPAQGSALTALERLGRVAKFELTIAEILEPLYRASGEHQKLIGVYEVQVRRAEDVSRKVELLDAITELYEDAAGDQKSAFETAARSLAIEPGSERTLGVLQRLAAATDRYEDLAGILTAQAEAVTDPELTSHLHSASARVLEESVGDPARAIEAYKLVLASDPLRLEAAEALERLYRSTEKFAEMSTILQRKAGMLDDIDAQKLALYQAASLEEDVLGEPVRAIAVYEKVLEIDSEDLRSVDSLIGLFLGLSKWTELLGAYTRKVDLVIDPEEKKQVLYEVGAVYERELKDVPNAIDTYQRVLELDPDDLNALGRLDVLYQAAANWQELLTVLTREAELTADAEEAVGFQYRVAALYETRLDEVARAIELYRELLGVQPDHAPTLAALEKLQQGSKAPVLASEVLEQIYEASGDSDKLIRALEVQVSHADDTFSSVQILERIATLYEESLDSSPNAFETYGRAVAIDSQNEQVLQNFERLAESSQGWARAAEIYDTQIAAAEDAAEQVVALGLRAASVYEVQLGNVNEAIARYRTVLGAEGENLVALVALDRLYSESEQWKQLAEILATEAETGETPDEILEFKFRLGQVHQHHLNDVASAVAAYKEVLSAAPEHEDSRAALEGLFATGVRQVEIGEILEPLYQASAEWEKLLSVREGQLSNLTDLEARSALLHRMAEEAEQHLVDGDRAFAILVRALSENPAHEGTVDELERLAPVVEEGWERLANAYADVLSNETILSPVLAATGHRLAAVFERELGDVDKAVETYNFVLTVAPADLVSLENLDRLYTDSEQWEELASVLERRAKAVSDEFEKVELHLRLGHTYEEKLAPLGGAAAAPRVELPSAPEASEDFEIDAEDDLVEPGDDDLVGDSDDVVEDIDEAPVSFGSESGMGPGSTGPASAGAPESVGLLGAAPASLAGFNRGRLDDAVRAYRVVFDKLQPENDDAIVSLERIYTLTEQWKELDVVYQRELDNAAGDAAEADVRAKRAHLAADRLANVDAAIEGWKRVLDLRGEDPEALRALAFLYEKQSRFSELTDVLERHFDIADSDEDRVHVLTMRARLFDEQLNRPDEALETYQRVLDIDYSNVTALRAIASVWRRRKSAEDLVRALHALVDSAASQLEGNELVETYREMAKLYQASLEQPFDAADAWRHLLEVSPGDFEALDSLEVIYRADERIEDVVGVKMQRAAALVAPEEQVRELLEVTELWRSPLGEYAKSTEAYQKILDVDPVHERAFKELEKLHTNAERWESLVELYLNRLEHYEEVAPRSELLRRIARVFEEKLEDSNQAFDALVNAFADDYFDELTSAYLEKVAQSTNRWSELLTTANAWLQEEQDRKRKIQLLLLLGRWYGENLGMSNYAAPYYQQVLQIDPQNVRVMRQMAAIERLAGNYPKVGQMLNKALEVAVTSDDRKAILTDLGDVLYRNLEQPDQGIPYYKRALEVDGGYLPALSALERIYEDKGQIPDLVEILTKKAGAIERPEDAVRQKLRLGSLLEEKMNDSAGAAKAYREVIEIDADSLPGLRGLERVLGVLQDWPALVTTLERQLEVVETEADRVTVLLRLAEIQEQQFLKADVAAARLEQALAIDPTQEQAYVALARCYRRLKQWHALIATFQRHIEETSSRDTKLGLYAQIGAVYRDELNELDQAIDAYQQVVDADDTNIQALEALSKLFERQGDGARAIDSMTRVADLTSDGAQQVDMYFRIGRAMEEKLSDRYGAREKFERALDIDPSHLPSLAALRTIAVDEADWDSACRYLEQEQSRTDAPRVRAKLLVELGKIRNEMLGERAPAMQAYEQAIELDAECEEAALPLVNEYGEQERWADAAPLAEMLVRRGKNRERGEQHMLQKMLGRVMGKVGEHEKSLRAYQAANQLDLTDQETIRGVADAAYAMQDWPTSLTNYQKVLTSLGEDDVESRTEVYYRLGAIKLAQGQDRQAINNYEKALALDGEHRPSLQALIAIYEKSGDNKQVAEYKRQILDSVFDGEERFQFLMEIGDLWAEKEKDPKKALEAYEEARDLKPVDHVLLHKMLENYKTAEEWQKMVDILDAIKDIEQRPKLRAKFVNAQAQLYRDKLEDKDRAVELFNEALDLDPEFLEVFERIVKILTGDRNWKQLERAYRKMLHRIAGKGKSDLEHQLWHQLGIVYRDRTAQANEAIDAFKMSASLVEEAPLQRQILAELYETSERWDDAIKEQRRLLKIDPLAIEPYQALYRLHLHKQSYDEAWCLAAAMSFMRKADEETERFFQDFRPKGMLPVTGRLANEHWVRGLFHPNESIYISNIFAMIVPAALQAKIAQLKAQGKLPLLDERFRQEPATSTVTFAKTFGWAAQVLGIQAPALYVRNDVQAYIGSVPSDPPASVAGQLVLSGFQPQELTFICGKHLTAYRPEHYLRVLFPTQAELTIMLFAGVLLAAPQQPMPPDMEPQIRATAQELARHMQPVQLEHLRQVVKQFLADGAKANVKKWNQAVELTACRAGLVVCGDLEIAKKIIGQEQQAPGDLAPADKLKELLLFAVSEEYSAIRRALGVAVQA